MTGFCSKVKVSVDLVLQSISVLSSWLTFGLAFSNVDMPNYFQQAENLIKSDEGTILDNVICYKGACGPNIEGDLDTTIARTSKTPQYVKEFNEI